MRAVWTLTMLMVLVLAGCLQSLDTDREGADAAAEPEEVQGTGRTPGFDSLDAPAPPPLGRTWTYAATGVWDLQPTENVVVAAVHDDGFLFAGATRGELWDDVIWGRLWHGAMDLTLNPSDTNAPRLFDWPLYDGKTWTYGDRVVVAHAAQVPVAGGVEAGFRMTVEGVAHVHEWTYAPSVGWLTSYRYGEAGGDTFEELTLTGIDTSTEAAWFEPGPYAGFGARHENPAGQGPHADADEYDLEEGHDQVVVIALATSGGHGTLVPPGMPPEPWSFDGGGFWEWSAVAIPASAGKWRFLHQLDGAEDWTSVEMRAVVWVEGPVPLD